MIDSNLLGRVDVVPRCFSIGKIPIIGAKQVMFKEWDTTAMTDMLGVRLVVFDGGDKLDLGRCLITPIEEILYVRSSN
jgi:hypothetical protein